MDCEQIRRHIKNVCLNGEYGDSGHITKFVSQKVEWFFAKDSEHTIEDEQYINDLFLELEKYTNIEFIKQDSVESVTKPHILIYIGNQTTFDSYLSYKIGNKKVGGYANWNAQNHKIYKSNVFVSSDLKGIQRKDVLREEITQALGSTGDTEYDNTIFYQYKYKDNAYFDKYYDIDKKAITFLYNKSTIPGQTIRDIDSMECANIERKSNGENVKSNDKNINSILFITILIAILFFMN